MSTRRFWLRWLLVAVVVGVVAHVVTVRLLPVIVMRFATARMAASAGFNTAVFPPRADEKARAIVRPSPDLLYAACAFDLRAGALRIRGEVPRDTYWSLSIFAGNTDNFFVLNDRQAAERTIDLVLARAGAEVAVPPGATLVESPSRSGVVLTRTLVASEDRLEELEAARRRFSCAPLS